jgi:hypothetical protein
VNRTVLRTAAALAVLSLAVVCGVSLGAYVAGLEGAADRPHPPEPPQSAAVPTPTLPVADIPGEDLASLPRYPGSVRSGFEVIDDGRFRLTATEFVAIAELADVRVFYQTVIVEHGWERVDINYDGGEWSYILIRGADEALIEIEERGGLVEIDLQLSTLLNGPAPALTDGLAATPPADAPEPPPPAPLPPAPPPAPPVVAPGGPPQGDDGDDLTDDGDDDDGEEGDG